MPLRFRYAAFHYADFQQSHYFRTGAPACYAAAIRRAA